tara:strand:- start:177 stop:278 length:102 start_codon:yes stop_codon:yes gene_type:complete
VEEEENEEEITGAIIKVLHPNKAIATAKAMNIL